MEGKGEFSVKMPGLRIIERDTIYQNKNLLKVAAPDYQVIGTIKGTSSTYIYGSKMGEEFGYIGKVGVENLFLSDNSDIFRGRDY
jgi:hypothetical protein